jgi:hypothetical protein
LARAIKGFNNNSADLAGDVYIYRDSAITNGVPDDSTQTHLVIDQRANQSEHCALTVSKDEYLCLTQLSASVGQKQTATVDFFLELRLPGKVFRELVRLVSSNTSGTVVETFDPPVIVPKNSDVRVSAVSSNSNTSVSARFSGYYATVLD